MELDLYLVHLWYHGGFAKITACYILIYCLDQFTNTTQKKMLSRYTKEITIHASKADEMSIDIIYCLHYKYFKQNIVITQKEIKLKLATYLYFVVQSFASSG
jgi:hypothetical protein